MSYDVTIADVDLNYTYNLSDMFLEHMPMTGGLRQINGMTGRQASNVLAQFWSSVHRRYLKEWADGKVGASEFCALYDAPNGWGSAVGALIFMGELTAACAQRPRHVVRVT